MKAIYKEGFIYEGAEDCIIGMTYSAKYPVQQPHPFKDGQELVKGVDYKLRCDPHFKTCMCRDVEKCEHEIAVPLNPIN